MKFLRWLGFILLVVGALWYFSSRSNHEPVPASEAESNLVPTASETKRLSPVARPEDAVSAPPVHVPEPLNQPAPSVIKAATSETASSAGAPFSLDINGLIRDAAGGLAKMTEKDAEKVCKSHEGHLSTIRELVNWSESNLKKNGTSGGEALGRLTPHHVEAINPDGSRDEFDVLYHGNDLVPNHKPPGDLGENQFLSSSRSTLDSSEILSLQGETGYVNSGGTEPGTAGFMLAVARCLPDKKH